MSEVLLERVVVTIPGTLETWIEGGTNASVDNWPLESESGDDDGISRLAARAWRLG